MAYESRPPNSLDEIRAEVLDEASDEVGTTKIDRWCWRTLNEIHLEHCFSWMKKNKQMTVAEGRSYLNMPFDFRKIRNLWVLDSSYKRVKKLYQDIDYQVRTVEEETLVSTENIPVLNERYTGRWGFKLVFNDSASAETNVDVEYYRWPRRPVEGTDICDIHPGHVGVLIDGIMAKAARFLKEFDQSNYYFQTFRSGLIQMVDQDVIKFGDAQVPIPYTINNDIMDWRETGENTIVGSDNVFDS